MIRPNLRWQSQLQLFLVLMLATAGITLQCVASAGAGPARLILAFALGAFLAVLTWILRAATIAAAVTGGLCAVELYLALPGWRTALWPLLALLLLTLVATRFGRARKEKLGVAEGRHGRTAAQVTANLGVAVLAGLPLGLAHRFVVPHAFRASAMRLALVAALAEAAADTLSSELGEVLSGEPRLLTTLRRVPAGTDGAVSLAGTFSGVAAAVVVAAVGFFVLKLAPAETAVVIFAAIAGLFVDSLLGAALERKGWLNNDAVNFLSGLASALLAIVFGVRY